jgi:biotin transport system substrate-specific component
LAETRGILENMQEKVKGFSVTLLLSLLGASLIALAAQVKFYLPWTPVPITGQTFAVLLTGALLGASGGGLSVLLYLFLGALGVPWFAATAAGGWQAFVGPTGGYLWGFVIAASFVGFLSERFTWARQLPGMILVMIFANFVLIHVPGLLWLKVVTGTASWKQLLAIGCLPFIPGDLLKIAAASAVAAGVKKYTQRLLTP